MSKLPNLFLGLVLLVAVGCGGNKYGPAAPDPDAERAAEEEAKRVQQQEGEVYGDE